MNWGGHVYEYCERTSPAFWGEPLDAVSNIAYVAAGVALWRMLRSERDVPISVGFMPGLAVLIGAGSFAFHTLATRWSKVLDIVPIGLFVLCYFASFLYWFYGLSRRGCLLGVAGFIAFTAVFGLTVGTVIPNRSGIYVPVLILIVMIAGMLASSRDASRARHWPALAVAGGVFALGLFARTIDRKVCGFDPEGTHFIWHLLTALLVFLVSRIVVRRWRALRGSGAPSLGATGAAVERPDRLDDSVAVADRPS
ncbi:MULTISPECIES: ceramidase domain-containing protein [unclassified Frankia]|uniref:ceramidase domain-containing protein n=1 Tax=unclassified Frankia TaxID=2632575 RepID=UPI001EF6D80C|nr:MULTISPECIES: ceramidase domain-containing protein [unclassified Frankia]